MGLLRSCRIHPSSDFDFKIWLRARNVPTGNLEKRAPGAWTLAPFLPKISNTENEEMIVAVNAIYAIA